MQREDIPELSTLLSEVEKKYGRPLQSTNDFNVLSALIQYECKEIVSVSTLKRLWGYVSQKTTPRNSTLDVLSRFLGYDDFSSFRIALVGGTGENSSFLEASCLLASDVPPGGVLVLGWAPNRMLRIRKTGDLQWEVVTSHNSKLQAGDRFEASCFFRGLPLFLPAVVRGGQTLPSYIAGKKDGLNAINIED